MSREKIFANGLYALNGLGSKRLKRLYEATGSAEGILKHSKNELLELAGNSRPASLFHLQEEYQNNPEDVFKRMEKFCMEQEEKGIYFTYIGDEKYPHRLLKISDPPFGLYYKGHLPKQETPIVSVIGARECSEYGRKCAKMFGETLAEYGVAVVSGMARGIDGISQSAALEAGGESPRHAADRQAVSAEKPYHQRNVRYFACGGSKKKERDLYHCVSGTGAGAGDFCSSGKNYGRTV